MIFQNREKKTYYKRLIMATHEKIWRTELSLIGTKDIREGIRREFDRVAGIAKELETKIEAEKDSAKKEELKKVRADYIKDVDALREQMLGKWNETLAKYEGGLDEGIKQLEGNISAGEEFEGFVRKQLKKL